MRQEIRFRSCFSRYLGLVRTWVFLSGVLWSGLAAGQGAPFDRSGLPPGRPAVGVGTLYYLDDSADLGMSVYDVSGKVPLWRGTNSSVTAAVRYEQRHHTGEAAFPESGQPLPSDLYDVSIGCDYSKQLEPREMYSYGASVGSAGDEVFKDAGQLTVDARATYMMPSGDRNAWLFLLMYSNNRSVLNNIPLPGVGYMWNPNEQWRMNLGLPFTQVTYLPRKDLTFVVMVTPVPSVDASVHYQVTKDTRISAAFRNPLSSYDLAEESNDDERLFFIERRLETSLALTLRPWFSVQLAGGYAFDRRYVMAEDVWSRDDNRIDLDDSPYIMLKFIASR